jgi:hypothetical protein
LIRGQLRPIRKPRNIMCTPNVVLRPNARIVVKRAETQNYVGLLLSHCHDVATTDRTEIAFLSRRRFISGKAILTANPPKLSTHDARRGVVCRGMRLPTCDAVTVANGRFNFGGLIHNGATVTAASHSRDLSNTSNRDRRKPRGLPLPHHRTNGSRIRRFRRLRPQAELASAEAAPSSAARQLELHLCALRARGHPGG